MRNGLRNGKWTNTFWDLIYWSDFCSFSVFRVWFLLVPKTKELSVSFQFQFSVQFEQIISFFFNFIGLVFSHKCFWALGYPSSSKVGFIFT